MKIDLDALNLTQSLQQTAPIHPEVIKGIGRQHQGADGDEVQISNLASQLAALVSAADPARLTRLQAAFQSGSYSVSRDEIAARLIRELAQDEGADDAALGSGGITAEPRANISGCSLTIPNPASIAARAG